MEQTKYLMTLIERIVKDIINEDHYKNSMNPVITRTGMHRNIGRNSTAVDNGGHASNDILVQVSYDDPNGANFRTTDNIVLSDNKFTIYKIKNFGNDRIDSTMSMFGKGSGGEKAFRAAIDTINGGAYRNGRPVMYRTITSESNRNISKRSGNMSKTFWEFSFDGGYTWNIFKPNPTVDMKKSKLVQKVTEAKKNGGLTDSQFFKEYMKCKKIVSDNNSNPLFPLPDEILIPAKRFIEDEMNVERYNKIQGKKEAAQASKEEKAENFVNLKTKYEKSFDKAFHYGDMYDGSPTDSERKEAEDFVRQNHDIVNKKKKK